MSFMAAATAIGLEGMAATIGAGAMMGATVGGVSNLVQGRGVFDNIGQNMLMGGAGAGIMSGIGSAVGTQAAAPVEERLASEALTQAPSVAAQDVAASINPPMPVPTYPPPISNAYGEGYSMIGQGAGYPATGNPYDLGNDLSNINPDFSGSAAPVTAPTTPVAASGNMSIDQKPRFDPLSGPKSSSGAQASIGKPELLNDPVGWIKDNPIKAGLGAYAAYNMMQRPAPLAAQAGPGGNIDKYAYHPAQYGPDGRAISQASYGAPTVTHYAARGGPIRFAGGGEIYSDDPGVGPYSDSAGRGPYSDAAGKGPYSSKESGLSQQISKVSPTMLTRYAKAAKNAAVQAAAMKELQSRSTSVPDYGEETGFAGGGITYNSDSQTYSGSPAAPASSGEFGGLFSSLPGLMGILGANGGSSSGQYSYDPKGQSYTKKMAGGGMASLPNEYAAGGKLLQGPGDGMSDSIPAVIKGPRPQRAALAVSEFVLPADIVSHLGNGSTDAGSKRLYEMMDRIRMARTGTKKQGKQINPRRFLPA